MAVSTWKRPAADRRMTGGGHCAPHFSPARTRNAAAPPPPLPRNSRDCDRIFGERATRRPWCPAKMCATRGADSQLNVGKRSGAGREKFGRIDRVFGEILWRGSLWLKLIVRGDRIFGKNTIGACVILSDDLIDSRLVSYSLVTANLR